MDKKLSFSAIVGINENYNHNNEIYGNKAIEIITFIINSYIKVSNKNFSCIVSLCNAIYNTATNYSSGNEVCIKLEGTNLYTSNEIYKKDVINFIKYLKEVLKQEYIALTFQEIELIEF